MAVSANGVTNVGHVLSGDSLHLNCRSAFGPEFFGDLKDGDHVLIQSHGTRCLVCDPYQQRQAQLNEGESLFHVVCGNKGFSDCRRTTPVKRKGKRKLPATL